MKTSTFMTVAFLISMVFAFATSVLFWWTYRPPPIKSARVDVSRVADDLVDLDVTDSAEFTNPQTLVPLALFLETKDETFVEIHYNGETLELSSRRVWEIFRLLTEVRDEFP